MENKNKKEVVAIVSGGLDSTTMIFDFRDRGYDVSAIGFNYGQRHSKELHVAKTICDANGFPYEVLDISAAFARLSQSNPLTNPDMDVPTPTHGDPKSVNVPNRNMIMLAFAAGYAISRGIRGVAYGCHRGDLEVFPDCRPAFFQRLAETLSYVWWHPIELHTPLAGYTKAEIVKRAVALGVPLGATWSCYKGGAFHCGTCTTCKDRRIAFKEAGVTDATTYSYESAL